MNSLKTSVAPALLLTALIATCLLAGATVARGDQVYHSERLTLAPVGEQSGSGQVVNIHANGPVVGAIERYQLKKAEPGTYEVWIQLCDAGSFVDFVNTAVLEANKHGNGSSSGYFSADDLAPFSGAVVDIRWVLRLEGANEYATDCTTVTID